MYFCICIYMYICIYEYYIYIYIDKYIYLHINPGTAGKRKAVWLGADDLDQDASEIVAGGVLGNI
jgi:hypothetical protein